MPAAKPPPNLARPLMVRPGAAFTCFSDGLCCTDIHALGPLSRKEARDVRALVKDAVHYHELVEAPCMRPGANGECAQRENGLCGIHRRFGAGAKPGGCRRFPYGLLSTPEGGRVTTEHRCPCRTLGERPPIDLIEAERSLRDSAGRLEVDHRAPARVPIAAERFVSFKRYREVERTLIDRLLAGERAEDVLGAQVLPALAEGAWPVFAAGLYEARDDSAGGEALSWFADALMTLIEGLRPPRRERPWARYFERAIARTTRRADVDEILNDWIADELWMMRWLDWDCTFDVARAELATRLAAARLIIDQLRQRDVRADQAAAEAVMICELGACNDHWKEVVDAIANEPSPAVRFGEERPA